MKFPYHGKKHGVWINTNGKDKIVAISDEVFNSSESEQKEVAEGIRKALGFDDLSIWESIEKTIK